MVYKKNVNNLWSGSYTKFPESWWYWVKTIQAREQTAVASDIPYVRHHAPPDEQGTFTIFKLYLE